MPAVDARAITTFTAPCGAIVATLGRFRVVHWPAEGGAEAFVKIDMVNGPSWVVDVHNDMPESVFDALLAACKR